MLLEGKSCVITGAGSGVGRASALVFAREGARVLCADVRDDWAAETVRLVEKQGGTAVAVACDVTREADVEAAVAAAVASFGRLDVMFNNAGVSTPAGAGPFETYDAAAFDRLIDINL
ncbi:MAG TPA: SDR family NAD(P)-dependent oxidoreductase, partial [Acidimicrobiales bacterium]|nr:SDR family NAD(P)-dependent oxidoreductase [Acidimicrobiales bacterium]